MLLDTMTYHDDDKSRVVYLVTQIYLVDRRERRKKQVVCRDDCCDPKTASTPRPDGGARARSLSMRFHNVRTIAVWTSSDLQKKTKTTMAHKRAIKTSSAHFVAVVCFWNSKQGPENSSSD